MIPGSTKCCENKETGLCDRLTKGRAAWGSVIGRATPSREGGAEIVTPTLQIRELSPAGGPPSRIRENFKPGAPRAWSNPLLQAHLTASVQSGL